ncbi:MAG: hypothetical protein JRJ87_23470, partial [Deltaproteobacteria bacterium]|nr:hypothetical protein [Deltaproteobacteria bacterium]
MRWFLQLTLVLLFSFVPSACTSDSSGDTDAGDEDAGFIDAGAEEQPDGGDDFDGFDGSDDLDGFDGSDDLDGFDGSDDFDGGDPGSDPGQAPDGLVAAPDGTGSECSLAVPCSLTTARDRVRTMTASMAADISIYLGGGTYWLDQPFSLGPQDSGLNGFAVIYQAYPGETPVLSGGLLVTGWQLHDPGLNIQRAAAPAGLHTRQLYVDGQRARRARGELFPEGFSVITHGYQAPDTSLAGFADPTELEFVDLVLWKSFRCKVESIVGTTVTIRQPCWSLAQWHTGIGMAGPTWIENAYEFLDEPGEWFHDRQSNRLYYIPLPGQDMQSAEVIAPRLEALV